MVFVTGRYCLKQIIRAEERNLPLRVSTSYRVSSVGLWSNFSAVIIVRLRYRYRLCGVVIDQLIGLR